MEAGDEMWAFKGVGAPKGGKVWTLLDILTLKHLVKTLRHKQQDLHRAVINLNVHLHEVASPWANSHLAVLPLLPHVLTEQTARSQGCHHAKGIISAGWIVPAVMVIFILVPKQCWHRGKVILPKISAYDKSHLLPTLTSQSVCI